MRLDVDFVQSRRSKPPAQNGLLLDFLAAHSPQGEDFESPIPGGFLTLGSSPKFSGTRDLVRDGRLLLENFNGKVNQTLLVRDELWMQLSKPKKTLFTPYELESQAFSYGAPLDGLIISAAASYSRRAFAPRLDIALKKLRKLPQRVFVVSENQASIPKSLVSFLRQETKIKAVGLLPFSEIPAIPALDRLILLEAHDLEWIGDPFMTHYLLSKGAKWYRSKAASASEIISFSLRHGIKIRA
jgi:hypothetical protein